MPRQSPYRVPTDVLIDQARKTVLAFEHDRSDRHAALEGIGLTQAFFTRLSALGAEVDALEGNQEWLKGMAQATSATASETLEAALRWRTKEVLPRVALAFDDDPRRVHFRVGELRSRRAGPVLRECRLLADAIRRFAHLQEAQSVGLSEALADEGERLYRTLEEEDATAVRAAGDRSEATARLGRAVLELSRMLAEVEKRAAVVLAGDETGLRLYRLNVIREYAARHHRGSASVLADDPLAGDVTPAPRPSPGAPARRRRRRVEP